MGKTDNAKTRPAALPGEGRQSGAKRLWAKGEKSLPGPLYPGRRPAAGTNLGRRKHPEGRKAQKAEGQAGP